MAHVVPWRKLAQYARIVAHLAPPRFPQDHGVMRAISLAVFLAACGGSDARPAFVDMAPGMGGAPAGADAGPRGEGDAPGAAGRAMAMGAGGMPAGAAGAAGASGACRADTDCAAPSRCVADAGGHPRCAAPCRLPDGCNNSACMTDACTAFGGLCVQYTGARMSMLGDACDRAGPHYCSDAGPGSQPRC